MTSDKGLRLALRTFESANDYSAEEFKKAISEAAEDVITHKLETGQWVTRVHRSGSRPKVRPYGHITGLVKGGYEVLWKHEGQRNVREYLTEEEIEAD